MELRHLITHSLLSSWLYAIRRDPYEDSTTERDSYKEFLQVLRREPTETTEAMQKGIDFEDLVTRIATKSEWPGDSFERTYEAAKAVAERVQGGAFQFKAYKPVSVAGMDLLLYGRLDVLKAGEIIDIKFSKSYERGKYFDSTQHPMYMELVPEAEKFTYLVSNGSSVWSETYRRDETPNILDTVTDLISWLRAMGLLDLYLEKW